MRRATRPVRRVALLLVPLLALAGCTYADREPGLFGRTPSNPAPSAPPPFPPDSTAAVPVLGDAVWTTVGPDPIPVRIALHGLRRVPGGTVLDWSVTALSRPGRVPGEPVDGGIDLPLDEERDLALVDAAAGRIYRPLLVRDRTRRCLCAPVSSVRADAVLDEPRLLQVAFPPLPAATRLIDVWTGLAPIFTRVPVAATGQVSLALGGTDLARPAPAIEPRARSAPFRVASGQEFVVEVDAILAGASLTSVVWTLETRTRGPGDTSGLVMQVGNGEVVPPWPAAATSSGARGCLCPDRALWRSALTEPGRRLTLVSTFAELRRGTTSVDMVLGSDTDGADVLRVAVTAASDGAFRSAGTVETPRETWTSRIDRPQPGWPLEAWPPPVPVIEANRVLAVVDRVTG
jgi:hypothetical protein